MPANREELKRLAAERAVSLIESGMKLGLGTGSTATLIIEGIGQRLRDGSLRDIVGVPTSDRTAELARNLAIPLTTLNDLTAPQLDLALDGADEVSPELNLIKGLGGALLREKLVEAAARRFVVVVDDSKLVERLGTRSPVPVEVVPFGWRTLLPHFERLGTQPNLRLGKDGQPFITDEGNHILDCRFDSIDDPAALDRQIRDRAGVIATGLFVGMATEAIVAGADGVKLITRPSA